MNRKAIGFFQKKLFFKITVLWTRRMKFWQITRTFLTKSFKTKGSKSKNYGKNLVFRRKAFFSKLSSGLIESSFDKRSELFLLKVRNWQNMSSILRNDFLKMFFWSRIMQFWDHRRNFLPLFRTFLSQSLKKKNLLQKKHRSQIVPLGSSSVNSATLPKCSCQKSKKCLIQFRKSRKKFFEKNPFSFKTILSAHKKQFCQTLRVVFAKSPE